jgi:hypothetical protein
MGKICCKTCLICLFPYFSDADIHICDFHRKRAMMRKPLMIKHGCSEHQEDIMHLVNVGSSCENNHKQLVILFIMDIY